MTGPKFTVLVGPPFGPLRFASPDPRETLDMTPNQVAALRRLDGAEGPPEPPPPPVVRCERDGNCPDKFCPGCLDARAGDLPPACCAACHRALVTHGELAGGVCEDCIKAEARRWRDETGGWASPNVRDLRERVLARVAFLATLPKKGPGRTTQPGGAARRG